MTSILLSRIGKIAKASKLFQMTIGEIATSQCSQKSFFSHFSTLKPLVGVYSLKPIGKQTATNSVSINIISSFHTGDSLMSRIKWRFTHKPYYHVKKTAKSDQSPITASNRAFIEKVLKDTYNEEQFGERYAYVKPAKNLNQDKIDNVESPLKKELEPWPRGRWDECGASTTRIGLIGRKIGVVPMWLKTGKPVLATMLHIEDNHVIKYIPPEDFAKTVVAQRKLIPYIMTPNKSISRGSVVVGALSADPSKYTKDYCGLFTESGLMPKKTLVRFPGK